MKTDKITQNNPSQEVKHQNDSFKNKMIAFLKNNKVVTILSVLLLIVFTWFSVKINSNEKKFLNEKSLLIAQYEREIDSLQIEQLVFSTEVFSWSVRSELIRNNDENLNQLLTVFVQESGANRIQLIHPKDKIVLMSSDKKFEGSTYTGELDLSVTKTTVVKTNEGVQVITPVMGFNNKIGVLLVELKQ